MLKFLWNSSSWQKRRSTVARLLLGFLLPLSCLLHSCSLPQVKAEDRLFLNVSLDFLGSYELPRQDFEGAPVGGLSGITYDRQQDRFYTVSDDRSDHAPARFYTLKVAIGQSNPGNSTTAENNPQPASPFEISTVEIEKVTTLYGEDGQPYPKDSVDLEGIALSSRNSVFISSEGSVNDRANPFVDEFDLATGQWRRRLPIPARFLPGEVEGRAIGVQDNRGFESLTLNSNGASGGLEPFRVFTATEAALQQDLPLSNPANRAARSPAASDASIPAPVRFLHYLVSDNQATLLAEHIYELEPLPPGAQDGGLSELLTLDQAGHFLSLERSFGLFVGFNAKLFQLAIGGATDTSDISGFQGDATGITPIAKQELLDLSTLDIPLDNLEGMALGPKLPDGSQSLLLISDDNFNPLQRTQLLLFRLRQT